MSSGWTGTFTFTYSGASDLTVTIRDILGNILVTSPDLPGIGGVGCSGFYLCQWNTYSLSFSGVAASVNFSGLAAEIAVDNLTFGS